MKKSKIYSMMAAVLIAAMSVGFMSCSKDEKKPEQDDSRVIMSKWFYRIIASDGTNYIYRLEFKRDGTYSYDTENNETINGIYRISQSEKVTSFKWINHYGNEDINPQDATLYKILASGSSVFDRMNVYYASGGFLVIHLYSVNELVQILPAFSRDI